ncbi:MAG TPA: type II toxin-antitoxin system PemK/MazF family toxin [Herpetosiphonaceae bacterium]|nr:type II toxin-antitoxin system PemK/MazF family toxin [Herpetosiphonaceae bacterium]
MDIVQGAIFWIETGPQDAGGRRPYVVLQNNIANRSRIDTLIVCGLTTQHRLAGVGGNVLLDPGKGNLPRQSVVNVSQLFTVAKWELDGYIGVLDTRRVRQILDGLWRLLEPRSLP